MENNTNTKNLSQSEVKAALESNISKTEKELEKVRTKRENLEKLERGLERKLANRQNALLNIKD